MPLMKGGKSMMSNKEIEVRLEFTDGKYIMEFELNNPISIDLYSDDSEQLKSLFISLMKELIDADISLKYFEDNSIANGDNQLVREIAKEYVDQLDHDLKMLSNNENLKAVREIKRGES